MASFSLPRSLTLSLFNWGKKKFNSNCFSVGLVFVNWNHDWDGVGMWLLPQLSPDLLGDLENRGLGAWKRERNVCSEGCFRRDELSVKSGN